jgi:hypothetical protein
MRNTGHMTRFHSILLLASLAVAAPAAAQGPGRTGGPAARPLPPGRPLLTITDEPNAQETQQHLRELMQQYPPSLSQVMSIDPTLATNPAYLEPYPALAAFLAQHPEIAHNPRYFFGELRERNYDYNDPKVVTIRAIDQALAGVGFLIGFLTVVGTIAWLLRSVIEHRKWQRVSKTHVDTHTKLMDRLTSNEDLITYMQSPAGRRFLEAAPIPIDGGPRMLAAPFGRILWSVQAGLVVAFLGGGLIYASTRLAANPTFADGELPLFVIGTAMVAIGAGFFVSAVAAYGLSRRLGLFQASSSTFSDPGAGSGSAS